MKHPLRAAVWVVLLVVGALTATVLSTSTSTVFAHANVATSEPAANSELEEPPEQIVIWFTEPLEPSLSKIEVFNAQGTRVDNDDSLTDRVDPSVMSVSLGDLENGTYTVVWRNVSTVDGHRVRGSYIFSVGEPLGGSAPVEVADQGLLQSPSEPVIRWLVLLGGLALVGGFGFNLLVLRPLLGSEGAPTAAKSLLPRAELFVARMMMLAALVAILASIAQLLVQAAVVHDVSVVDSFGDPVKTILSDTDWGRTWIWRIVLLGAAALVAAITLLTAQFKRRTPKSRSGLLSFLSVAAMGLGAGMLFTISWTSHGAAVDGIETPSIVADYLHLLASSLWVGGLLIFAPVLLLFKKRLSDGDRASVVAAFTPRFSAVAVISIGVLVITGTYGAWAQVTIIEAFATPYGWSLIGKLALVVVILVIGAFNLLWIRGRLATSQGAVSWLGRLVAIEAVIAVLIILAVGVITSLEPARQVASREGIGISDELRFDDTAEGVAITLTVAPGHVGQNRLVVSLEDRFGNAIANADGVSVGLTSLDVDLGKETLVAENLGDGQYVVEEGLFSVAGAWQTAVVVRRSDAFDARTAFRFIAARTSASGSALIAPDPDKGQFLLGLGIFSGALLFMGVGVAVGGWWTKRGASLLGPGLAGAIIGVVMAATSPVAESGFDTQTNPFAPDQASLDTGQQLFVANCQVCHGAGGLGDGPGSEGLDPPPADLIVHVPLHPDPDLFDIISDGVSGSAMSPFKETLTEDEIWHLINYIQTLE